MDAIIKKMPTIEKKRSFKTSLSASQANKLTTNKEDKALPMKEVLGVNQIQLMKKCIKLNIANTNIIFSVGRRLPLECKMAYNDKNTQIIRQNAGDIGKYQ